MNEESLFAAALDRADPADRAAFLAAHCPDPAARRRVEVLLAAHAAAGSFLAHPAVAAEVASALAPADPDVTRTQTSTDPDATGDGRTTPADADEVLALLRPSPRPGALGRLDHYDVLEVVGSGGFGTVLKAFDARLHRVVAVKVLAPQLAASGAARARFHREAKTAAAVKDDHVVNIHAVAADDAPVPFLVMEFVAGQTLQQKLDKAGPLPPREVLRIGTQAARGLAAAHAQGLIHRDIKPANVLLENGVERVKITDFGLARAADDASLSQSGVVAGTPMYMSPEQARGDGLDPRTDLFSLGSVLYTLCTGRPPFRAGTTIAVLKRVIDDDPRPVREVNPEVPRWLADVVEKLHAKDPADRFQTAQEVADLLAGYLAEFQQQGVVVARAGVAPRRRRTAATGWAWWFGVPLVLFALLSAAAALPDPVPPDDMTRRDALIALAYGFGFIAGVSVIVAAGLAAVSRRWAVRAGAFTAAALIAAAVNGALGAVVPREPVPAASPAVVSLRFNDTAVQYRVDEIGPNSTGVAVAQTPLDPGVHWVWFQYRDRHYRTARFVVAAGERTELDITVTADGARATLAGRPLAVTAAPAQLGVLIPLRDAVKAKERERDAAKARYDAGRIGDKDYQEAELELAEARARLAEAEAAGEPAAAQELVRVARAWRAAVAARVEAGVFPPEVLARADARVADARARLARAGGGEPETGDAARLKGEWEPLAVEADGKPVPAHEARGVSARFGDGDFSLHLGDGQGELAGTYRLEPEKKQVLFHFPGQPVPVRSGYRLTGDRLGLDLPGFPDGGKDGKAALRARERMASRNNLLRLGVAAHNYVATHQALPPPAIRGKDGTPLLSWRVALLHHVEQDELYKQFKLDEPWDSAHNKSLVAKMPKVFAAPGVKTAAPGLTHYRTFVGPGTAFEPRPGRPHGVTLDEFGDGLANTLLVVEAADPVAWTKPDDLPFDPTGPLPKLGVYERGAHVLHADGHVAALAPGAPEKAVRALVTRGGGETEPVPFLQPESPAFPPVRLELVRRGAVAPPPRAVAPFGEAEARAHQEAWAKPLGVPVEFTNHAGVAFRLIPPGEFGMGFTDAELAALRAEMKAAPNVGAYERFAAESSGPRHTARITRPFYLAKYETTAAQFRRFVAEAGHRPTGTIDWTAFVAPGQEDRQPVVGVSWADADAFCRWLGAADGGAYDLPTEAQWEYAARAGGAGLWSFGDDPRKLIDHAAVGLAAPAPGPVGLKAANPFGLFDVYGGVTEWCRDWHVADYYRRAPIDDPVNPDPPTDPATGRAARGGSWNAPGVHARAAFRAFNNPTNPTMPKGFRVALGGDLKAVVAAAAKRPSEAPRIAPAAAVAPFDGKQAAAYQEAWARHLGVPVEYAVGLKWKDRDKATRMTYQLIPPGEFLMGADPGDDLAARDERPQHPVTLTHPFYLGTHEVTVEQFTRFVEATGYRTKAEIGDAGAWEVGKAEDDEKKAKFGPRAGLNWRTRPATKSSDDHPVHCLAWADAEAFCVWLAKTEGKPYRLPTEAEWEFACRAGTTTRYGFGTNLDPKMANLGQAPLGVQRVGYFPPNPFGLYETHGNVAEWVQDAKRAYGPAPATDPVGAGAGAERMARGGHWFTSPTSVTGRSSDRRTFPADRPVVYVGFRVALDAPPAPLIPKTDQAAVGVLRNLVATKEKAREVDGLKVRVGSLSPHKLYLADHDVAEARARLAEAERDAGAFAAGLRETFLAACRYRDFEYVRVAEGLDRAEFDRAEGLVAEARVKLARAGVPEPDLPPQPAPLPRPRE